VTVEIFLDGSATTDDAFRLKVMHIN